MITVAVETLWEVVVRVIVVDEIGVLVVETIVVGVVNSREETVGVVGVKGVIVAGAVPVVMEGVAGLK